MWNGFKDVVIQSAKESVMFTMKAMILLTLVFGILLGFGVALDLFLFREEDIFTPFEMSQPIIYILLSLFLKRFILPRVKRRVVQK
ncbi:hypothetical protein NCCP133_07980 [Cytobacillus sp. NCCP-133]|nr:hypothetical protein NCCP133_07980 [Cytobacillus sp. NCCP-133]